MSSDIYPYIVFLSSKRKRETLTTVFGSKVPLDILGVAIEQGISEKIYQKSLIEKFKYSNKTVIHHLKEMVDLGLLEEGMEKSVSGNKTVWVKYYLLSDTAKWLSLLMAEEGVLSTREKTEIFRSAFSLYLKWALKLSRELGVDKRQLEEIFRKELA